MAARFEGEILTRWLDDGRKMELVSDVTFFDEAEKAWIAPKGAIIDGASIPRMLWSLYGSPFVGKYWKASVVHDVYCVTRREHGTNEVVPHEAVHKMFHEACLAAGVKPRKAEKMHWAVREHGPKWDENGNDLPEYELEDDDEGDFL